jgi:hypothetical protein
MYYGIVLLIYLPENIQNLSGCEKSSQESYPVVISH